MIVIASTCEFWRPGISAPTLTIATAKSDLAAASPETLAAFKLSDRETRQMALAMVDRERVGQPPADLFTTELIAAERIAITFSGKVRCFLVPASV